jgi:hypothetical protein
LRQQLDRHRRHDLTLGQNRFTNGVHGTGLPDVDALRQRRAMSVRRADVDSGVAIAEEPWLRGRTTGWYRVSPRAAPGPAPAPFREFATAFVRQRRRGIAARSPHPLRRGRRTQDQNSRRTCSSTDLGRTWRSFRGFAKGHHTPGRQQDHVKPDLLFAGTGSGLSSLPIAAPTGFQAERRGPSFAISNCRGSDLSGRPPSGRGSTSSTTTPRFASRHRCTGGRRIAVPGARCLVVRPSQPEARAPSARSWGRRFHLGECAAGRHHHLLSA